MTNDAMMVVFRLVLWVKTSTNKFETCSDNLSIVSRVSRVSSYITDIKGVTRRKVIGVMDNDMLETCYGNVT